MTQDPIIKEIRKIRQDIEAEFGNDADKYFQHIQQIQKNYKNLICRSPKPRLQVKTRKPDDMSASL